MLDSASRINLEDVNVISSNGGHWRALSAQRAYWGDICHGGYGHAIHSYSHAAHSYGHAAHRCGKYGPAYMAQYKQVCQLAL